MQVNGPVKQEDSGSKTEGKADKQWVGRTNIQSLTPEVPVQEVNLCHQAGGEPVSSGRR